MSIVTIILALAAVVLLMWWIERKAPPFSRRFARLCAILLSVPATVGIGRSWAN